MENVGVCGGCGGGVCVCVCVCGVIGFKAIKYQYAMYTIHFLILYKYPHNSAAIIYHCIDVVVQILNLLTCYTQIYSLWYINYYHIQSSSKEDIFPGPFSTIIEFILIYNNFVLGYISVLLYQIILGKLTPKVGSHFVKRYLSERRRTCGIYAVCNRTKQVDSVRELTIFSNLTK